MHSHSNARAGAASWDKRARLGFGEAGGRLSDRQLLGARAKGDLPFLRHLISGTIALLFLPWLFKECLYGQNDQLILRHCPRFCLAC